jgi:hypothetical protein
VKQEMGKVIEQNYLKKERMNNMEKIKTKRKVFVY